MAKLGRRRLIRVSLEADKGTPVTGAVECLVYDPLMNPDDNTIQRTPAVAFGGQWQAENGPSTGTCTFRMELRSDGTSALDAGLLACLQACGMKLDTGVLNPTSLVADQKTLTIDKWSDGLHEQLSGAAGTFEVSGEWGKQVLFEFTFSGLYAKLADAALPAPTHTAIRPMLAKAATLSFAGETPVIGKFSIDPNNPVEPVEDITADEGVGYYIVGADRRYVIGFDPLVEATADLDFRGLWAARTESAFSLMLTDGTVNVTIAAPKLQAMPPQESDRDSKMAYEFEGQCNMDDGDDELTITAAAVV